MACRSEATDLFAMVARQVFLSRISDVYLPTIVIRCRIWANSVFSVVCCSCLSWPEKDWKSTYKIVRSYRLLTGHPMVFLRFICREGVHSHATRVKAACQLCAWWWWDRICSILVNRGDTQLLLHFVLSFCFVFDSDLWTHIFSFIYGHFGFRAKLCSLYKCTYLISYTFVLVIVYEVLRRDQAVHCSKMGCVAAASCKP